MRIHIEIHESVPGQWRSLRSPCKAVTWPSWMGDVISSWICSGGCNVFLNGGWDLFLNGGWELLLNAQDKNLIVCNGGCNFFLNGGWELFLNADDNNLIVCNGGCNFFLNGGWELFLNAGDKNLIVCNGGCNFYLNGGWKLFLNADDKNLIGSKDPVAGLKHDGSEGRIEPAAQSPDCQTLLSEPTWNYSFKPWLCLPTFLHCQLTLLVSSWSWLSFCTAPVQAGVQGPCRRAKTPWQWRTDWARGPQPRLLNVTLWTD